MQYFKGDEKEQKMVGAGLPVTSALSLQKDLFFDGAYEAAPLGDLIYDTNRAPLARAMPRDIFRMSFKQIFDAFVEAGSFESYLTVFRKIFGDDVEVVFTVPGPGKLNIDIAASGLEISRFVVRRVENNAYVFEPLVTQDGDQIVFQTVQGFQSQYELEQMLFELVPAGIYTNISLTVGS